MSSKREWVAGFSDEILVMDEFEDALVGVCHRHGQPPVALYDQMKIIEQLVAEFREDPNVEGVEAEEMAWEHFYYNIIGGWVGDYTPAFVEAYDG